MTQTEEAFEQIRKNILEAGKIRNVPQFLFVSVINDASRNKVRDEIIEFKEKNPTPNEIDFILESPGGSPADAYRIIRTLRNNFDTVNVIIPFWAKSAATLLSLGASSIVMDEFGECGPLDVQIKVEREDGPESEYESALTDEFSVKQIEARSQEMYLLLFNTFYGHKHIKIHKNVLSKQILGYLHSFYEPLLKQINPYNLGKKKRKLEIGKQYAQRILFTYNKEIEQRKGFLLIDYLVNSCPEHGYVIDYDVLSAFLGNVQKTDIYGQEYKKAISNLTTLFINGIYDDDYVGFIV